MKSFTFWANYHDVAMEISTEQQGEFYRAVIDYIFDGTDREAELPFEAKVAFKCVKPSLKRSKTRSENGACRSSRDTVEGVREEPDQAPADTEPETNAALACAPCDSKNEVAATPCGSKNEVDCDPCESKSEVACTPCESKSEAKDEQNESKTQASLRLSSSLSLSSSSREGARAGAPAQAQPKVRATVKPKARSKPFRPPTPEQVSAYAAQQGLAIDARRFCDYYESKGWTVGKNPMRSWQAAVRNWARRDESSGGSSGASGKEGGGYDFAIYG